MKRQAEDEEGVAPVSPPAKKAKKEVKEPPTIWSVVFTSYTDDYKCRRGANWSDAEEPRLFRSKAYDYIEERQLEYIEEVLGEGNDYYKKYWLDGDYKTLDQEKIKEDIDELWEDLTKGEFVPLKIDYDIHEVGLSDSSSSGEEEEEEEADT